MRRPGYLGETEYWFGESPSAILYRNPATRLLHSLVSKVASKAAGSYYDTRASRRHIRPFIAKHGIRMLDFDPSDPKDYSSFNQFFARKLASGARPVKDGFISPADSRVLVIEDLKSETEFWVKNNRFNLQNLLVDSELSKRYIGGTLLVFRLKPEDYHRFHFPAEGFAHKAKEIPGKYHVVYKTAYDKGFMPIEENKRHLVLLENKQLGLVSIVPTGALGVSRIVETYTPGPGIKKADEMGFFQWGGSVISILVEPNKIRIRPDLLERSAKGIETYVEMGEQIAKII